MCNFCGTVGKTLYALSPSIENKPAVVILWCNVFQCIFFLHQTIETEFFKETKLFYLQLFFHGDDMKSLHKYVDPDCLPENYGGNLPAINYSSHDWYPDFVKNANIPKGKL